MVDWKKILISPNDSLEHAIKVLQKGGCRIALVSDENNKLLGAVTDGDIRRALINKLGMNSKISQVMNDKPIKASKSTPRKELLSIILSKG